MKVPAGTDNIGRQFLLFLAFAGLAALVNVLSRAGLSSVGISFSLAIAVAYVLGMFVNFTLNKYLNFKSRERSTAAQANTFVVVAMCGLLLVEVIAGLARWGISRAGIEIPLVSTETAAHATAVGLVAIYSFLAHRFLTFDRGILLALARLRNRH